MLAAAAPTTRSPSGGTYGGIASVPSGPMTLRMDVRPMLTPLLASVAYELAKSMGCTSNVPSVMDRPLSWVGLSVWKFMPKPLALSKTRWMPLLASVLTAGMLSENWSAWRARNGPRSRPSASDGV